MIYDYVRHFTKSRSRQRKKGQMKKKEKKNKNKKVRKKKLTWHNAMLTKATNYRLSLESPEASLKLFSLLPYRICGCTWHESRCVSELNYYHLALEFPEASLKLFPHLLYRIYGCTWHESRCVSELDYYQSMFKVTCPFTIQNLWLHMTWITLCVRIGLEYPC